MPVTRQFKHLDEVVDDVMRSLEACTAVQRTVVAKTLSVTYSGNDDILGAIRERLSDSDFPARRLADLVSRLIGHKYRHQGDSLFSVMDMDGPKQELVAKRTLDAATVRFLDIVSSQGGLASMTERQAREVVADLIPGAIGALRS